MTRSDLADRPEAIRRLGRAAYLCKRRERLIVVKRAPQIASLLSRVVRSIVGGSLPFRNEWFINKTFTMQDYSAFNWPRMVDGKCGDHLEFEYLEDMVPAETANERESAVTGLLELNSTRPLILKGRMEDFLFRLLERPPYTLVRRTLFSGQALRNKFRIIIRVLDFSLRQRSLGLVLLHNDLAFSNVLLAPDNTSFLVDFEDCVFERKWILMDFIDLTFDRNKLFLDYSAVNEYSRQLFARINVDADTWVPDELVRICLIRHALYSAENPDFDADTRRKMTMFLEVLLSLDAYEMWRTECIATARASQG